MDWFWWHQSHEKCFRFLHITSPASVSERWSKPTLGPPLWHISITLIKGFRILQLSAALFQGPSCCWRPQWSVWMQWPPPRTPYILHLQHISSALTSCWHQHLYWTNSDQHSHQSNRFSDMEMWKLKGFNQGLIRWPSLVLTLRNLQHLIAEWTPHWWN